MPPLAGQVALVTGGAVRVGRAIALALAVRGAAVGITYRTSGDAADATLAELRARGVEAASARCDQRHREQVGAAVAEIERALGPIDALINNASIFLPTPLAAVTDADWDDLLATNLKGPFWFCQAVAPGMRARGRGAIVNMADIAAERPWASYLPYCASKAGLVAMTRGLAVALAPEVRVNAIAPGAILWPDDWSESQRAAYLRNVPLRRIGTPEDVAEAVVWLLERTEFVTGQVLRLDGGRSLV